MRNFITLAALFVVLSSLVTGCSPDTQVAPVEKFTTNYKKVPEVETDKIKAHKFKEDQVGRTLISKYEIYWDTSETDNEKRNIQLHPTRAGGDHGIHKTDYTWARVKQEYPK